VNDVSKILSKCPFCGSTMDVTPLPPFAKVSCPSCQKHSRVKTEFGPYQLVRRLSTGGMSVLFVARDTLLDREVAVKILNEEYSVDERRISAFEEEARVTASLSHPNIVRVLTTGRAFGRFFIAMELVPGGHFEHHIRTEGKIPESRMIKLAIQIASGLKAAHEANLIHRDIKPGNILLDADGNAKIVDFGLALVTQGGTALAEEFWATPYYVPPETIDGQPEDFRSDIYAFGASLYHALAGKPPCDEERMAVDILRAAKQNIVPLKIAEPELSMAICEIVDKAMAYHPHDRYASYDELISDLEDAANRLKHGVTRESAKQVTSRRLRARRNRRLTIACAGLLAGITLISALAWLSGQGRNGSPVATTPPADQIPPDHNTPVANASDVGRLYQEARDAYTRGTFGEATERFGRLFRNSAVPEPTRTWAGIQALIAAMLNEDQTRARHLSGELRQHLADVEPGDPQIKPTLLPLLTLIHTGKPVVLHGEISSRSGPAPLIAYLIVGIHEWQYGDYQKALPHFRAALDVSLDENAQWFDIHQDVARTHLADAALLNDPACHIEPAEIEAAKKAAERLAELRASVRTRGPVSEILRGKMNRMNDIRRRLIDEAARKRVDDRQDRREPSQPPVVTPRDPAPPPIPTPPPGQPMTRAIVMEMLANYEFRRARESMLQLGEDQIAIQQRTAWMAVARGAERFMNSLAKDVAENKIPLYELTLKSGESVTSIGAHPGRTPADSEGNPIPWSSIHPDSYIEWHRARIQKMNESERIHAHEDAIAFDLLVGDSNRARTAIHRISETNANFEQYWKLVLRNYPP